MKKIFLLGSILSLVLFSRCSNTDAVNSRALEVVKKFNSKCPMVVDSETRIDGIEMKKPNTILYKYTLVNLSVESVDTASFARALKPGIISTLKTNGDIKDFKDQNATFEYLYKDKNNKFIYLFTITPKDYKL